jgi:hypothetical protein
LTWFNKIHLSVWLTRKSSARKFVKVFASRSKLRFLILRFDSRFLLNSLRHRTEWIKDWLWRTRPRIHFVLRLLNKLSKRLRPIKILIALLLLLFFYLLFHSLYSFHHHILFFLELSNLTFLIIHFIFLLHPLLFMIILHHVHLFSNQLNVFL